MAIIKLSELTPCKLIPVLSLLFCFSACTTIPEVKTQDYAKISQERTYEHDFSRVWKAAQDVASKFQIVKIDPKPLTPGEVSDPSEGKIETDWSYSQSRDKFEEYQVDGAPRKIYLQSRFKYTIVVSKTLGGTHVEIKTDEEIEKMKSNGTSAGFTPTSNIDSSRGGELLEKINIAILSAQPDSQ